MRLTEAQRKALTCLDGANYRTPSEIGWAIGSRSGRALKAQGAGRIGGSIASSLMKLGYATNASSLRNGFAAYAITPAGRAALAQSVEKK